MPRAVVFVALAALAPAAGCGYVTSPATAEASGPWLPDRRPEVDGRPTAQQDAIVRALDAAREHFKAGYEALAPTAPPSEVARMAGAHADHLAVTDVARCPGEFRTAFARHAQAWRKFHTVVQRFPDAYPDTKFMDDLGRLFHGDESGGHDLGGGMMDAVERVVSTHRELVAAAESYGVVGRDPK